MAVYGPSMTGRPAHPLTRWSVSVIAHAALAAICAGALLAATVGADVVRWSF